MQNFLRINIISGFRQQTYNQIKKKLKLANRVKLFYNFRGKIFVKRFSNVKETQEKEYKHHKKLLL